jgi:hypothetical protein
MHTIYQNAVITIASVDCEGSSPGMQTRSALERFRRRPLGSLDTRGWAFQEQMLSPRVLSYAGGDLLELLDSERLGDGTSRNLME